MDNAIAATTTKTVGLNWLMKISVENVVPTNAAMMRRGVKCLELIWHVLSGVAVWVRPLSVFHHLQGPLCFPFQEIVLGQRFIALSWACVVMR